MASTSVVYLAALLVCLVAVNGAPQFGGSFSQANAQAGAFGGGPYQRPGYGYQGPPGPPGYGNFGGPGVYRRPGFGGLNRGLGGGSISISKSISISRGGGGGLGGAQSSASSNAGAVGK